MSEAGGWGEKSHATHRHRVGPSVCGGGPVCVRHMHVCGRCTYVPTSVCVRVSWGLTRHEASGLWAWRRLTAQETWQKGCSRQPWIIKTATGIVSSWESITPIACHCVHPGLPH